VIRYDCRHYRASKPCAPSKQRGAECPNCTDYAPFRDRILFIKLDAVGDVLRSASMLPVLSQRYRQPYIAWLTRSDSAELVGMMPLVDEVLVLSEALPRIAAGKWTQVISLSNDITSASLATLANGERPVIGFDIPHGVMRASNPSAERWLNMAAFDRLKRSNMDTYQSHMLAILEAGEHFEPPQLVVPPSASRRVAEHTNALLGCSRRRIAINIGSWGRWPKKMLDTDQIASLVDMITRSTDAAVVLVGGAAEREKTETVLSKVRSRAHAMLTPDSIVDFVATLMQMNVLLCGDTLALHIATAIKLPVVAVFGPTSMAEIADFGGLVEKVASPALDCLGCYGDCAKVANCMSLLDVTALAARVVRRLTETYMQ
jgi:ADP-heptose:LPS heptosyltransferase